MPATFSSSHVDYIYFPHLLLFLLKVLYLYLPKVKYLILFLLSNLMIIQNYGCTVAFFFICIPVLETAYALLQKLKASTDNARYLELKTVAARGSSNIVALERAARRSKRF